MQLDKATIHVRASTSVRPFAYFKRVEKPPKLGAHYICEFTIPGTKSVGQFSVSWNTVIKAVKSVAFKKW